MLFFQNLVDETQMPKPQKYTDTFILTKKLFIVGLRGRQNISIPVERPCTRSRQDFFQFAQLYKNTVPFSVEINHIIQEPIEVH